MSGMIDLEALRHRLRWHDYRRWHDAGEGARWPGSDELMSRPPFPEACADCGRHRDDHPRPLLALSPEASGRLFLAFAAAVEAEEDHEVRRRMLEQIPPFELPE